MTVLPLIAAAALATAAPAPYVAYDAGGGEEDHRIVLRRLDGSSTETIGPAPGRFGRGPSGPRFSPDGRTLLFGGHHRLDRDAESLWTRPVAGGRPERIPVDLHGGILRGWDWSPDGRRIVFSVVRGGVQHVGRLSTARLDGTGLERLGRGQYPTWAPEGRRIAFVRRRTVHVVRPDGGRTRRVADAGRSLRSATISPDGRTVLYTRAVPATAPGTTATSEWHAVDLRSGADEVVAVHGGDPRAPLYTPPAFLPDGSGLAAFRYEPGGAYALVTLDPGAERERVAFTVPEPFDRVLRDFDVQP